MPENLRHAHERNDEVLERIYNCRRWQTQGQRVDSPTDLTNTLLQVYLETYLPELIAKE